MGFINTLVDHMWSLTYGVITLKPVKVYKLLYSTQHTCYRLSLTPVTIFSRHNRNLSIYYLFSLPQISFQLFRHTVDISTPTNVSIQIAKLHM